VTLYGGCLEGGLQNRPGFWKDQKAIMLDLAERLGRLDGHDNFTAFFLDWRDSVLPDSDSIAVMCGRAGPLLEMGLGD
jgi:hypothetical protein